MKRTPIAAPRSSWAFLWLSSQFRHVLSTIVLSKKAIAYKRPPLINRSGIVFHQDNARPHTSIVTRQKLRVWLGLFIHPPCSPDLAPSECYLLLPMENNFAGEKFASRKACANRLSQFSANRDEGFYEINVMILPSKWQQVANGAYLP